MCSTSFPERSLGIGRGWAATGLSLFPVVRWLHMPRCAPGGRRPSCRRPWEYSGGCGSPRAEYALNAALD